MVSELKTASPGEPLYFTPELIELLRRHRARQAEERLAAGDAWQDHGLIFPSQVGTPFDPRTTSRAASRRCASGPGSGTGTRTNSATRAPRLMLAQGTELRVVSEVLGHTSISITKDVYGHLLEDDQQSAAEAMTRALFGA